MTMTQLLVSYLASSVLVGVLGVAVAVDRGRSDQVRTCAAWVAMTCFAWPLMAVAIASIVVSEDRRRRARTMRPTGTPVGAGRTR